MSLVNIYDSCNSGLAFTRHLCFLFYFFVFNWGLIIQSKMHKSQIYMWKCIHPRKQQQNNITFFLPKKFPYNYFILIHTSLIMSYTEHVLGIAEQSAFSLNCWFISFVPFFCYYFCISDLKRSLYITDTGLLLLYFS